MQRNCAGSVHTWRIRSTFLCGNWLSPKYCRVSQNIQWLGSCWRFCPCFKCCDGSFSRNKTCVNATLNKKKKKKLKKQVCQGFSYVMSKYSVCDDIWNYYFWSKILCRKMLQSFRKLHELFNTEYVISFIMTKYVFTCRYWQYCARNPTKVVGFFFFFFRKMPPF